ncbi:MAG: hypothetical protein GF332_04645 [Candidatus Moranbacteria bacterium]|nr:hypothetical protein [Candidatus Moranbacteria bacterium]
MNLNQFCHTGLNYKVRKPGPALVKIMKKLRKIRKRKLCGLCAIGEFIVDIITEKSNLEEASETTDFHDRPGGSPANVAVNFFKVGSRSHLIAKIGNDYRGKFLLKQLNKELFPHDGIVIDKQKPTTKLLSATGNKYLGDITKPIRKADVNLHIKEVDLNLVKSSFVVVSGVFSIEYPKTRETILKTLKEVHNNDQLILIDPNFNGYSRFWGFDERKPKAIQYSIQINKESKLPTGTIKKIDDFLQKYYGLADIITPSVEDYLRYFGNDTKQPKQMARKFYEISNKALVILSMGAKGNILYDGLNYYHIPAYKDVKVVCTNGAGDAMNAGFLAGLERSSTYEEIIYSCALGNVLGAITTSKYGSWIEFPGLGKWYTLGRKLMNNHLKIL